MSLTHKSCKKIVTNERDLENANYFVAISFSPVHFFQPTRHYCYLDFAGFCTGQTKVSYPTTGGDLKFVSTKGQKLNMQQKSKVFEKDNLTSKGSELGSKWDHFLEELQSKFLWSRIRKLRALGFRQAGTPRCSFNRLLRKVGGASRWSLISTLRATFSFSNKTRQCLKNWNILFMEPKLQKPFCLRSQFRMQHTDSAKKRKNFHGRGSAPFMYIFLGRDRHLS